MIKDLKIDVNNGVLKATYSKKNIDYIFRIDGFILPKGEDLYNYVLNKIKKEHNI